MKLVQCPLGFEIQLPHHTLLMGGIASQFDAIKVAYPQVNFVRVKQIHGDAFVESENDVLDYQVIADGHYSRAQMLGLCVVTADCMPVFLIHEKSGLIAGIHAGWRGVANRIVAKSIAKFHAMGAPNHELQVIVGPHIQQDDFEVGFDVRNQILSSVSSENSERWSEFSITTSEHKARVDLRAVMNEQLLQEGVPSDQVTFVKMNTYADPLFHSHRRDQERAGRQISFIYRHG